MRATKVLLASGMLSFAIFFFQGIRHQGDAAYVIGGSTSLKAFEFLGAFVSLYLMSMGRPGKASLLDWLCCASVVLLAGFGFVGFSITLFALYLVFRNRKDANTVAAGTVAAAVAVQAVWAPLIFSKLSFIFLQIDAGITGWLVGFVVPGASWSGTIVSNASGHEVEIAAPCASFHNLSLASLCWVTLTMLHRPYWLKSDFYVGLVAALIQFGFNIGRLVFICLSLPMYQYWHEGFGKHIFAAVATACAIIFVQISLVRRDQRDYRKVETRSSVLS